MILEEIMTPIKKIDIILIIVSIIALCYLAYNVIWIISIIRKKKQTPTIVKRQCINDLIESLVLPIILMIWKLVIWGVYK